jgi:ABC-type multidrug transport system fused ATPase/permease subunit
MRGLSVTRMGFAVQDFSHHTRFALDLCFTALDSKSEQTVVDALKRAMKYCKSMIMVTHRLGVIRSLDVNRVLVLEQGEIVEEGHPEDLLRLENGHYASLAREQGITFGNSQRI